MPKTPPTRLAALASRAKSIGATRVARSPATELSHASLLVRHIALCRLLHGGGYRLHEPSTLVRAAASVAAGAESCLAARRLLECLAALRAVETAAKADPVHARRLVALRTTAEFLLAEHGYRTVCGDSRRPRG